MTVERLEFKAAFTADDTGAIEGKAWDFSSPDRVGDVIEPAAFIGAVGKSIPMLFAHDQAQAVGVWDSVTVEADGLKVKGKLLVDDVARAKEVRSLVRAGAVKGLSVGFMTKKAAPRKGGGRTISDLELVECSIVAVPAHPGAQVSNIKDLDLTTPAEQKTTTPAEVEVKAADLKAANDNIAALTKRLEEAETKLSRPNIITKAEPEITPERKAFTSFLKYGEQRMPVDETKALVVADDTRGGYLAPVEFSTEIIKAIVQYSPVRQVARVGSTGSSSIILPKRTGRPQGQWVGETEQRTGTESTYGQLEIGVHEVAVYSDVSLQLLEDAAINVEAEITSDLAEEFARIESVAFVNGDGTKKPLGFMNDADIGFNVSGSAATIADSSGQANGLIDLLYALKPAYRANATWMMNSTTLAAVRKMKDANGVYIWAPGAQAGEPGTLLGRPILDAVDMPDAAANAFPIAVGDFNSAFRVYDRVGMSVLRDPYSLAATGKVRFHARRRVGAGVTQPEAIRKLKCSV
ncbi:phage major capsid protein [Rhizobium mesoamericanum]|uniref:phage major capsid protein n=1 Tax=Rhizobium mesoamericanum TaxID=1079800 RepID=UPI0004179278|nr:phage major capsid protein [Rhizobium mesoamericanum]